MSGSNAVNFSDTGVDFFWQLQMGRVFDRGKQKLQVDSKLGYFRDLFFTASIADTPAKSGVILTARSLKVNVYLYFDDTCSLFDRGKYAIFSSLSYWKLCILLLLGFGYESIWVIHSMALVCIVHHVDVQADSKLIVNMPERDEFWLPLFTRVGDIEQAVQLLVQMLDRWEKAFVISQLQIIWVYCHQNFSTNCISAGVIHIQLIQSLSTTHVVVKIHVYTSMMLLTPSRGRFSFFRLYQILEYKDTASDQVVVLIKVTVVLVSKWTATYGYESVYRADHVLSDAQVGYLHSVMFACLSLCSATLHEYFWCFPPWSPIYQPGSSRFQLELYEQMMTLQMLLTGIHILLVLKFGVSSQWELNLLLMGLWSARNVSERCIHSPSMMYFIMCCWYHRPKLREYFLQFFSLLTGLLVHIIQRPHQIFVGVYFSLSSLVSSYCTSAGNVFLQMLKVQSVQVFLISIVGTGLLYLHYAHHALYGCFDLWTSMGGNFFSLYFVYTCYVFDRGKGFDGYIFMDSYSETSIYEFALDHGYQLELLQATLTMFLFVQLSAEAGNSGLYLFFLLFPSEVCGRLVTHKTILVHVPLSPCSSLHPFFTAWYFTHCCKDLTIFSEWDSSEYYLPCYTDLWGLTSETMASYCCIICVLVRIVVTHLHTTMANFPFALHMVFSLRWKFAADSDAQPNDVMERIPGQVTLWLIVKDRIGSQFMGARMMMGQLAYLFISEARIEFAAGSITSMAIVLSLGMILVSLELRQLTQTVASTVQVKGVVRRGKYLVHYISAGKGATLLLQFFLQELSDTKGVPFDLSHQVWLFHMVQQQIQGDSGQYNSGFTLHSCTARLQNKFA